MNVSINTKFMKQRETARQLDQEASELAETGRKLSDEIYANVEAALK